ncbi:MAG: pentapeptide repeat-containing protein [Acidobacteriota bacterium]
MFWLFAIAVGPRLSKIFFGANAQPVSKDDVLEAFEELKERNSSGEAFGRLLGHARQLLSYVALGRLLAFSANTGLLCLGVSGSIIIAGKAFDEIKLLEAQRSEAELASYRQFRASLYETIYSVSDCSHPQEPCPSDPSCPPSNPRTLRQEALSSLLALAERESRAGRATTLADAPFLEVELSETSLTNLNMKGACFSESELVNVSISNSRLEGARMENSIVSIADAKGANVKGATVCGTAIADSNLDEADFTNASFAGSALTKSTFRNTKLACVDWTGAILSEVDLTDAHFVDVSTSCENSSWDEVEESLKKACLADTVLLPQELTHLRGHNEDGACNLTCGDAQ